MIQIVINPDKKTARPQSALAEPKVGEKDYIQLKETYNKHIESLPTYPIKGSMCKSGIFIEADILAYHAGDKREAELHEDNSVTLHGPYK